MDTWQIVDVVAQVLIFILGLSAVILVSCLKNKWGNVLGLIHQPFWYFTTLYNDQYGLFAMSLVYTVVWVVGIWQWFSKSPPAETV